MLELVNVTKRFNMSGNKEDERTALDNVSLQIKPGDFITIIGGNGSGKSTSLNIISGALTPDKGKVLLNGFDTTKIPEHQRAAYFGRVFQDPMVGTAANLSVYENLEIAFARGRTHKPWKWGFSSSHKKFFIEELKKFDLELEDRMNQKVGVMSGGQRQALTLLMATMRQTPSDRIIKRDYIRFTNTEGVKTRTELDDLYENAEKTKRDAINKAKKEFASDRAKRKSEIKNAKENYKKEFASIKAEEEKFTKYKNSLKEEIDKVLLDARKDAFIKNFKTFNSRHLSHKEKKESIKKVYEEYRRLISKYDLTKQILLLDEHTAALDPKTASKVLELTEKIVKENQMTTIMVTHNMKDAIKYGNRLIMMSHGKVVVDISGEEKKKLTVEQLLAMFQVASKDDTMSDSAILGD